MKGINTLLLLSISSACIFWMLSPCLRSHKQTSRLIWLLTPVVSSLSIPSSHCTLKPMRGPPWPGPFYRTYLSVIRAYAKMRALTKATSFLRGSIMFMDLPNTAMSPPLWSHAHELTSVSTCTLENCVLKVSIYVLSARLATYHGAVLEVAHMHHFVLGQTCQNIIDHGVEFDLRKLTKVTAVMVNAVTSTYSDHPAF